MANSRRRAREDAPGRGPKQEPTPSRLADERAQQLFDEGARLLASHWDDDVAMVRHPEHPAHHAARGTLDYAIVLLREGNAARAERAIRAVLALQETTPGDAHYGNVRWTLEEDVVSDLNGVEFTLDGLNYLLLIHANDLPPDLARDVRRAVELGLDEIDRLNVHPSYTNIALSDICNSVIAGQTLGDERYVERGARRLDEWLRFTNRSGGPHEFNSPTYCAVDIQRVAFLAEHTTDAVLALKARVAEERLWLHVATHVHPELAQIAGPHSRSYFDGWTGAGGYLKLMLWRLLGDDAFRRPTPYALRSREEGEISVALGVYHCPPYIVDLLADKRYPFQVAETTDAAHGVDINSYMTASYALGTASRAYTVGDPPEPWPAFNSLLLHVRGDAGPGYGVLLARYLIGDQGLSRHTPEGPAEDLWDAGQFAAAQDRNRAIVAYGLRPHMRPASSYRLSLRMLGVAPEAGIWTGTRRIAELPTHAEPGDPIVVEFGDTYVALIPLEPSYMGAAVPVEVSISGAALIVDVYNYRGPPKSFWEHRSQGGPFYQGNVRNALVLEVGERAQFADLAAFRAHIADACVVDNTDHQYEREISYASAGGSLSLRYSLWDMRTIERRIDGLAYSPPMARAGCLDGPGWQWRQTREGILVLGRARLLAGTTPKWLVVNDDRRYYVFVNPTDEESPLWLETPETVIECDGFGFGRVVLDERAAAIDVDAVSEIAPVRVRSAAALSLRINGTDVSDRMIRVNDDLFEFAGI